MKPIEKPWARDIKSVLKALDTSAANGLATAQVEERRTVYGYNKLREAEQRSVWSILIAQYKSLIVGLLVVAAILSFALGEWVDSGAIVAVVLITTMVGFVTELRAVRSMEALKELATARARVRRDGQEQSLDAESLVMDGYWSLD